MKKETFISILRVDSGKGIIQNFLLKFIFLILFSTFILPSPISFESSIIRRIKTVAQGGLEEGIARVEAFWREQRERGRFIKRDYTAREIAMLRAGSRPEFNIQNEIAWEFYDKLRSAQANQTLLPTIGGFDETSAMAMAENGMPSVYAGGWMLSQTEGDPDLARRPRNAMLDFVKRISRRLWRAYEDQQTRRQLSGSTTPEIDFKIPIMVDMDTGFDAPYEYTLELVGTVVAGVPHLVGLVHIEDQATGCKKCGHLGGRVLVPTQTMIERLNEIRKALDVLGVSTLIVGRTDAEGAEFITSWRDVRDQPFILGSSNPNARSLEEFAQSLKGKELDQEKLAELKEKWRNEEAKLMTRGEAVAKVIEIAEATGNNLGMGLEEWREFAKNASFKDIDEKAKNLKIRLTPKLREELKKLGFQVRGRNGAEVGVYIHGEESWRNAQQEGATFPIGINIYWDKDQASVMEGDHTYWMIDSGLKMAIARSKSYLPYTDVSWMEQKAPIPEEIEEWSQALDEEWKKILKEEWGVDQEEEEARLGISLKPLKAMNISPNFNWIKFFEKRAEEYEKEGMSWEEARHKVREEIQGYSERIAKAGIQLPFNTFGLGPIIHHSVFTFIKKYQENPIQAWVEYQEMLFKAEDSFAIAPQEFAGLISVYFRDIAGRGTIVATPLGSGSTLDQFREED